MTFTLKMNLIEIECINHSCLRNSFHACFLLLFIFKHFNYMYILVHSFLGYLNIVNLAHDQYFKSFNVFTHGDFVFML